MNRVPVRGSAAHRHPVHATNLFPYALAQILDPDCQDEGGAENGEVEGDGAADGPRLAGFEKFLVLRGRLNHEGQGDQDVAVNLPQALGREDALEEAADADAAFPITLYTDFAFLATGYGQHGPARDQR